MKTIEYLFNNGNNINTLSKLLEDWNLNGFELDANKQLNVLLYIEEKSKMVHSVLENNDAFGDDTNLCADICLQPQNLLYKDMGFKNSVSFSITMNDAKAFVANVAFALLTVEGNIMKIKTVIMLLLVLIIQHTQIVNDDIKKCVLKSIIILSQEGNVTKQKILDYLTSNNFCPHGLKKCKNYVPENGRCTIKGNSSELFKGIDTALNDSIKEGIIVPTKAEESGEQGYRISNFLEN